MHVRREVRTWHSNTWQLGPWLHYKEFQNCTTLQRHSGSPILLIKSQGIYLHVIEKNLKLHLFKAELSTPIPKSTLCHKPPHRSKWHDYSLPCSGHKVAFIPDISFSLVSHFQSISKSNRLYLHNTCCRLHRSCFAWIHKRLSHRSPLQRPP